MHIRPATPELNGVVPYGSRGVSSVLWSLILVKNSPYPRFQIKLIGFSSQSRRRQVYQDQRKWWVSYSVRHFLCHRCLWLNELWSTNPHTSHTVLCFEVMFTCHHPSHPFKHCLISSNPLGFGLSADFILMTPLELHYYTRQLEEKILNC